MRRAQIRHGLDAEQLRRGRKRKSESGLRDWTEAEDVQLLKVVWSGARGLDRSIPTRGYETCKKRLQLIGKHVDPQWLVLHKSDATLTANVIAVTVGVGRIASTTAVARFKAFAPCVFSYCPWSNLSVSARQLSAATERGRAPLS